MVWFTAGPAFEPEKGVRVSGTGASGGPVNLPFKIIEHQAFRLWGNGRVSRGSS